MAPNDLEVQYQNVQARFTAFLEHHAEQAAREGWGVFDTGGSGVALELQRDDEADVFESDEAAVAFVRERAVGDRAACAAMEVLCLADAYRLNCLLAENPNH